MRGDAHVRFGGRVGETDRRRRRHRAPARPYYLGAGLEKQNSCLLTLLGARADGTKELLAIEIGYRESKDSWAELLRSLRDRGLHAPAVFIGDGNLELWAALSDVFPESRHQRCWNHYADVEIMPTSSQVPIRPRQFLSA